MTYRDDRQALAEKIAHQDAELREAARDRRMLSERLALAEREIAELTADPIRLERVRSENWLRRRDIAAVRALGVFMLACAAFLPLAIIVALLGSGMWILAFLPVLGALLYFGPKITIERRARAESQRIRARVSTSEEEAAEAEPLEAEVDAERPAEAEKTAHR